LFSNLGFGSFANPAPRLPRSRNVRAIPAAKTVRSLRRTRRSAVMLEWTGPKSARPFGARHDGQFQTQVSKTHVRASRRDAPESCIYLPPQGGRGECRMPAAPAASCALGSDRTHTSNNEYTGITRHSRTQWFYGVCRALPGDRAVLPPSSADMFCLSPVGPT
jgi:hypothetical protein